MPPTTPPMVFFDELLRPEPLLEPLAARPVAVTFALVVTGTTVLEVRVPTTVLPPWTWVKVWTTWEVELVVI